MKRFFSTVLLLLTALFVSHASAQFGSTAPSPNTVLQGQKLDLLFPDNSALIDNSRGTPGGSINIYCAGHERKTDAAGVVYYRFNIVFNVKNTGPGTATDFDCSVNYMSATGRTAWTTLPSLAGGSTQLVTVNAWLPVGTHPLYIKIDDRFGTGTVSERDETNNMLQFNYTLNDECGGQQRQNVDITSGKSMIIIGGAVGGSGGKYVRWGETVKLNCHDALPGGGANNQYAFNVTYVEKNAGTSASGTYTNKIYSDANVRAINTGRQLDGGALKVVTTQPYLDCGGVHKLILRLDDGNAQAETNEGNNEFVIYYELVCDCK